MNKTSECAIRHFISSVIDFPFIIIIWGWVNPLLTKLHTGKEPDVMFVPESGFFNCCCSIFWFGVFMIFSTFFEKIFVTKFGWKYWLHIPAFPAIIFLATFIFWLPIGLILGPMNLEAVLTDAIDNSIWGSIYWCIFIFSGYLFKRFIKSSSSIDSG